MRFRKKQKESEKDYERRKKEVLSHLNNDNSFLKVQDVNFKDILTAVVDEEGQAYFDKEWKPSAGKGQYRVYKCLEMWTLDDLLDKNIPPEKALNILGMMK